MELPILKDILIILGLGLAVQFVFTRLRIPTIVGFLLTGILAGPSGFALVAAVHEVEIMAEIGVILLLFSLGLEFSFDKLLELKRAVLLAGTVQVMVTFAAGAGIASVLGAAIPATVFIGFLLSLSSTAIVLKLLQEEGAVDTPHGRTSIGILIFQDIIIVPMMMVIPLLAGSAGGGDFSPLSFAAKVLGLGALLFAGHRWLVPLVLFQVARTRSRELFVMSISFIAFSIAWLTSQLGLSLALGAFLAGLIVSESEFSDSAFANILPFRDIFMSFFFVSIGMLLSVFTILQHPLIIIGLVFGVLLLKIVIAGFAALLMGYSFRSVILAAFALAQIGEFSFILSKVGMNYELLSATGYQIFLAVSVLTMMATPFVMALGRWLENRAGRLPLPRRLLQGSRSGEMKSAGMHLTDHLIITGYGLNGRNLARAARAAKVPYLVIDLNPDTIRREKEKGIPVFYGDASQEEVLKHAGIGRARILVVAINDAVATRRVTRLARRLNPGLYVIVRTRFVQEVEPLFQLGADEVVPEEFETSIEIFTRVLRKYLIPQEQVERLTHEIRADSYQMLRSRAGNESDLIELKLPEVETFLQEVKKKSTLAGRTLAELQLRRDYRINVLLIFREGRVESHLTGDTRLLAGDRVLFLGTPADIRQFLDALPEKDR